MATMAQLQQSEEERLRIHNIVEKLQMYGATGRISDIVGRAGHNRIVTLLEEGDVRSLKLLHDYVGWMLEYCHMMSRGEGD